MKHNTRKTQQLQLLERKIFIQDSQNIMKQQLLQA